MTNRIKAKMDRQTFTDNIEKLRSKKSLQITWHLFACFLALTSLLTCTFNQNEMNSGQNISFKKIEGKYLVDNVFFPQETLTMKKFRFTDTIQKRKLMIELRNDSIYLNNYNFGGWYGKWFCNFHQANAIFKENKLYIDAQVDDFRCTNNNTWQKIIFQFKKISGDTLTFIKIKDTTNCERKDLATYGGRGSRGSDIDFR